MSYFKMYKASSLCISGSHCKGNVIIYSSI